jgi:hypothetical protein
MNFISTKPDKICTDITCPVCLNSIKKLKKNNIIINVLKCGHILCLNCKKQLSQSNLSKCPVCRYNLVVQFNIKKLKCSSCNCYNLKLYYLSECNHIYCDECIPADLEQINNLNFMNCSKCYYWRVLKKIFLV